MDKFNVEAEGGELILQNTNGDHAIIPKKDRRKLKKMVDFGSHSEIDDYIDGLPAMSDYAPDGSIISSIKNWGKDQYKEVKSQAKELYESKEVQELKKEASEIVDDTTALAKEVKTQTEDVYYSTVGDALYSKKEESEADNPYVLKDLPDHCKDVECTSFITNNALKAKGSEFIDRYNYRGSGWTMHDNIKNRGGDELFNIFNDETKPTTYDKDAVKEFIKAKTMTPEFKDYKTKLQPGDYVSLYYPESGNYEKAYTQSKGKMQTTHGGEVVKMPDGTIAIRHNVHGALKYDSLDNVFEHNGYKGTGIAAAIRTDGVPEKKEVKQVIKAK